MHGFIKFVGIYELEVPNLLIRITDESTQQENWFMPVEETVATGVAMRVENGFFRVFPYENSALIPFEAAVRRLNPVVAVKIRNTAVQAAIRKMFVSFFRATYFGELTLILRGPNDDCLYIDANTRIQILDSIDSLPQAEKDQCGAFIVIFYCPFTNS